MPKKKNTTRKDGRIAVQVYLGRVDGKRKYKTVYGLTQKEANKKAEQLKAAMHKGLDVTSEKDTFGKWADTWIKIKSKEVSRSQTTVYESAIKHLKKYLEHAAITKIKSSDVQNIILDLAEENPNTKKPASKKMLKSVRLTAIQIFRLACENRVIEYNPAEATKIPNTPPPQARRALTEEEQRWILETEEPSRAKRAAMLMMLAGLRRGELIPLMWNDIDLDKKTITVNKAVEKIQGKFEIKNTTKTAAGMRVINIPQILVDYLKTQEHESLYVCVSANKKFHTQSSWTRMWDSYLADLNIKYGDFSKFEKQPKSKYDPEGVPFVIPKITPHWLRHTFATSLYFAGVDVLTAKDQLGHADIKTTLSIYTHLDSLYKQKSMEKLDEYFNNASHMQVKG